MTPDVILAHVVAVLADIAPDADPTRIDRGANLREELDIDSMDFLHLVQGLHARTGVDIPESDYAKVGTLDALIQYIALRAR